MSHVDQVLAARKAREYRRKMSGGIITQNPNINLGPQGSQ
jgi:hypothetical protein